MPPLRFGIVGVCGAIGATHVRAIQSVDSATVTAVTDLNEEGARRVADAARCRCVKNFDWLVKRGDVDALCLCTPTGDHLPQALAALGKGKHVLVERPVTPTIREADKLIAAARKADRKVGVVFQERLRPAVLALRRMLIEGRLGRLYRATLVHAVVRSQHYFELAPWRAKWETTGGGATLQQGSPWLDLLVAFLGQPLRLYARAGALAHETEVEDMASALVEFPNGVQATVHINTLQAPGQSFLDIVGDAGTARIEANQLRVSRPAKPLRQFILTERSHVYAAPPCAEEVLRFDEPEPGHAGVIAQFVRAVRGEEPLLCDVAGARGSLEMANAMLVSAHTGKPVDFPLKPSAVNRALRELAALHAPPKKPVLKPVEE